MNNIGFDLDNVLNENTQSILKWARDIYGITEVTEDDFTEFHIENVTPITFSMLDTAFKSYDYWINVKPKILGIRTLRLLHRTYPHLLFPYIHIITDRYKSMEVIQATRDWFYINGINYFNELNIVPAKEKADFAKERDIKYFIEDREDTAISLAKVCKKVLLLDKPWNRNSKLPENVIRVQDNKEGWDIVFNQMKGEEFTTKV